MKCYKIWRTYSWVYSGAVAFFTLKQTCETRNTFCGTRSSVQCNFFHFWSRDVHPVQNLLLCTKFHENRMIFQWDMAIYRFSKWWSSAILELFYHHTKPPTKSLLLAAAACQISCQSDTQIWRYSYLNFSLIWLEMPIQPQKWKFRGLWTHKCNYSSLRPQKTHPCVNPCLLSYQV